jgi:sugar phosphate permease
MNPIHNETGLKGLEKWKGIVFLLCFLCMVSRHATLESWYMAKIKLTENSSITKVWLSVMDSCYLFSYAIGNVISGSVEDHYSVHIMIGSGMILSSITYFFIILLGNINVYNPYLYLLSWLLQGFLQSTVWPGCVALLSKWTNRKNRGKTMGLFSSSSSVGNSISALVSGLMLSTGIPWTTVITFFSVLQLIIGINFIIFVKDSPELQLNIHKKDIALYELNIKQTDPLNAIIEINNPDEEDENTSKAGIPFVKALFIPNILNFSLAYACAKFLAYGMIMWLPTFLDSKTTEKDTIGLLASSLDLGSIFGGIVCGWLGDKFEFRPPVLSLYLFCAVPTLFLLSYIGAEAFWMYYILIPLTGFFVGGANLILASAVPADLAQTKGSYNLYEATATVAGIIDGSGGIGAGIGTFIVGALSSVSWSYVFFFMIFNAVLAFFFILKISIRDVYKWRLRRRADEFSYIR